MPGFIQLGTFTLDLERQRLFHLGEPVALRPKTSVVLCCLAQRPGKFVSADELQQSAWPGLTVTPQTLTNVIGELRKLSRMDDPAVLLIETRYGEGYRLLIDSPRRPPPAEPLAADATRGPLVEEKAAQLSAAPRAEISASNRLFVGREAQLAQLRQLWSLALTGQRQVVFLGGMAGIGKTALVQVFIDWLKQSQAPAAQTSLVAVGRCRARHGEAESYAPLLDALEQISLDVDLIADLRRCAPSWLAQMPWLLPSAEMTTLRQSLAGIGTLRVRREGVKLFEEISLRLPLLLLIDDLHDADDATIDLLAALIERTTPARLMIVATHRHPDPSLRAGPLKTLLAGWRRSAGVHRILLDPLPRPAVHAYLQQRFDAAALDPALVPALEQKSGGNPLFLAELLDSAVERGWAIELGDRWRIEVPLEDLTSIVPDSIRGLIREHLEHLAPEQLEILEAASLVGVDFTVSLVAAALTRPVEEVARACRALAEHGPFISADGERVMADGSIVEAYRFTHALYQRGLAERLGPTLRRALHGRIGAQLEREYGSRAAEIAPRLAMHFELAEQREQQLRYLEMAATAANGRCAFREASEYLCRLAEALNRLPPTPQTAARRASVLLSYGNLTLRVLGVADPETNRAYEAAFAAAADSGDHLLGFRAQMGRCYWRILNGEADIALGLADDLIARADDGHPELATVAHLYRAYSLENRGRFAESARHIAIAERMLPHAAPDLPQGSVIEASVGTVSATVRTVGGRLRTGEQPWLAIAALLRERALPWSRVYGLILMARVTVVARDVEAALALTDEATSVSEEFGLDGMTFADLLVACRAWARAELGHTSLGEFAAVLEQRRRDGHHFFQSYLELSLAEMQIRNGQWAQAEAALERASQVTVELAWSAEVERVKGELATAQARNASTGSRRRQVDPFGKATKHFQNAIRIARDQGAALFEARATKGLVRIERLNRTTR